MYATLGIPYYATFVKTVMQGLFFAIFQLVTYSLVYVQLGMLMITRQVITFLPSQTVGENSESITRAYKNAFVQYISA